MTVSELMQALADAGAPFEAIIIAVKAVEEAKAASDVKERTRSKAAERQARYRERNKTSQSVTCDGENVTDVTGEVTADVTGDDERNADPLPLPPNDNNSNPPTPAPENNTPREREAADRHVDDWIVWRAKHPYPRPHWAPADLWADFMAVRKRKSATNSKTAHDRLLRDVEAMCARTGWPPGRVLRACVERDWKGIYETDEMKAAINANGNGGNQRGARQGHGGGRDNRDGFQRHLDDIIGQAERSAAGGDGGSRQLALGGPDTL